MIDKAKVQEIYDALCAALTRFEESDDMESQFSLYEDVVEQTNKLAELLN